MTSSGEYNASLNANANANANTTAVQTLTEAATSLQNRNDIQSVLQSIITDIEMKHELETELNHEIEVSLLKGRCENAERALEEYKLLEVGRRDRARSLVEDLMYDLGGLSGLMKELELIKSRKDMDDCGAGLDQDGSGDVAAAAAVTAAMEQPQDGTTDNCDDDTNNATNDVDMVKSGFAKEEKKEPSSPSPSTNHIVDATSTSLQKEQKTPAVENKTTSTNINNADSLSAATTAAAAVDSEGTGIHTGAETLAEIPKKRKVVTKKKKIKRRLPPTLQSLSNSMLMSIFEFMDAIDIVNMAQTNVRMYSKVDSIFGLGGAGFDADGRDCDDEEENFEEVEVEVEEEVEVDDDEDEDEDEEVEGQQVATSSDPSKTLTSPTSDHSLNSTEHATATIVSIPTKSNSNTKEKKPQNASTSSANRKPLKDSASKTVKNDGTSSTTANSAAAAQTSTPSAKSSSTSSSTTVPATQSTLSSTTSSNSTSTTNTTAPTSSASASASASADGFQISSSVAATLADKLSPVELSSIIQMFERLRTKEREVGEMRKDFEELNATLDGTLSVKEVMTAKMEEMKLAMSQNEDISAKMNRQAASDQEVIAFLDERVQELERQVGNFDNERMSMQNEMEKIKKASEKKLSLLGDMLTFEREQMVDHEKEWKSTKKVLVKEVKHRRAQILALEAEKDGFAEQNVKLKDALLSLSSSSKSVNSKSVDFL